MTLAVEFVMGEMVTRVADRVTDDIDQVDTEEENRSVTHIDYIHDQDIKKTKPGFVSKLQSTIEVIFTSLSKLNL